MAQWLLAVGRLAYEDQGLVPSGTCKAVPPLQKAIEFAKEYQGCR